MPNVVEWATSVAQSFDFSTEDVRRATRRFVSQLEDGLVREDATLNQIPSYITQLPSGKETGLYLAADLGGTNLRICSVDLHGNSTYTLQQSKVSIPTMLMTAPSINELFAFLATQLEVFLLEHHSSVLQDYQASLKDRSYISKTNSGESSRLKLGFTFSFAFSQTALDRGVLKYWTKGFSIPNAIGLDICSLFQAEIDRVSLPVQLVALVNDTVGTLLARAYTSPEQGGRTIIGAVFGTGTNGAYVEKRAKITKLNDGEVHDGKTSAAQQGEMILNTEWGSFDNEMEVLPLTEWDKRVDEESLHPGIQVFEKMVSGMYLGEILRHVLVSMVTMNPSLLLTPQSSPNAVTTDFRGALDQQFAIDSSFLSLAATDFGAFLNLREEMRRIFNFDISKETAEAVKILALAIGRRAARLAGVAIAGCVIQSGVLVPRQPRKKVETSTKLLDSETEDEVIVLDELKENKKDTSDKPSDSRTMLNRMFRHLARIFCVSSEAEAQPTTQLTETMIPKKDQTILYSSSFPSSPSTLTTAASSGTPDHETIAIGIDGSLYEYYPLFEKMIGETLKEVEEIGVEGEQRITIGISRDGSGVGAALAAGMAEMASNQ